MLVGFGNQKGGVGKTTLCVCCAVELARSGRHVALVDADRQSTAARWHGVASLPVELVELPLDLKRDADRWVATVRALTGRFDEVLVDLPPHLGPPLQAAALVADVIVLPCQASGLDVMATQEALELVAEARGLRRDGGSRVILVPSRVDARTGAGKALPSILAGLGTVAPSIRQRSAFADAIASGLSVQEYVPAGHPAAAEIAALVAFIWEGGR